MEPISPSISLSGSKQMRKTDNLNEDSSQENKSKPADFVLAYKKSGITEDSYNKIDYFIFNLEQQGFELHSATFSVNENIIFIKIHAPRSVLLHFADIFGIDLAFQNIGFIPVPTTPYKFMATELTVPNVDSPLYRRARATVSRARPKDITTAEKGLIIYKVLTKNPFGEEKREYGIEKLIHKNIFDSAYPLHDGEFLWTEDGPLNDRQLLLKYWSNIKCWCKQQPLDLIEKYYGSEIAFYFAWLGFYNRMLIAASIMGFLCFFFGTMIFIPDFQLRSQEVCNSNKFLCPRCLEKNCKYELLKSSCFHAHMIHLFDNPLVITSAALMSIWATIFLKLWLREEAMLQIRWNLQSVKTGIFVRPEFEEVSVHTKISKITGNEEPYLPKHILCYRYTCTSTVILLLILLMLLGVFGVAIYVKTVSVVLSKSSSGEILQEHVGIIAASTGSIMSVVFILMFELLYEKIALWLTNLENPRTQQDFDNSYIYKYYAMAFVNNYGVIFYIAFIKARFYTHPGDKNLWTEVGGVASDLCDPTGCMIDLAVQMVFIVVAKNLIMTAQQYFLPQIMIFINKFRKTKTIRNIELKVRWEKDYLLNTYLRHNLVDKYMEMIIQYGFVTFFVAAFPLAPLLALFNNVIELRVDALKFTNIYRRPVAFKVANIAAWNGILEGVTYIGVATNAFVIAFTSECVQRVIFRSTVNSKLHGFVNSTLSVYNVSEFPETFRSSLNVSICYYPGKRYPPDHPDRYQLTNDFWHELAIKFFVIVFFEHIVMLITGVIAYVIPSIPFSVREHIKYERDLIRELTLKPMSENYLREQTDEVKINHEEDDIFARI